jgi:hypothetical protein
MSKIGRNQPCPCGSGKKYKKCCASLNPPSRPSAPPFKIRTGTFESLPAPVQLAFLQKQAKEALIAPERIKRYGHVRPPIIVDHQGYKVALVGNRLIWAQHWKTFHDVLHTYIAGVVGIKWGQAEQSKPYPERHPIMQWYHDLRAFQKTRKENTGADVYEVIATGPAVAYLSLAYDLYVLEHHALLPARLVNRLKSKEQFQGARYECHVAACFVRAGFKVIPEDETDPNRTHCEFNAFHHATNAPYSVEAKSRHRHGYLGRSGPKVPLDQIRADIYALLQDALRKEADHPRIIFIDANAPPEDGAVFEADWFKRIAEQVKRLEDTQGDRPYPSAFVFFTNSPDHYAPVDELRPEHSVIFTGLNLPEFREDALGNDPQAAQHQLAQRHPAVFALHGSLLTHADIPHELEW